MMRELSDVPFPIEIADEPNPFDTVVEGLRLRSPYLGADQALPSVDTMIISLFLEGRKNPRSWAVLEEMVRQRHPLVLSLLTSLEDDEVCEAWHEEPGCEELARLVALVGHTGFRHDVVGSANESPKAFFLLERLAREGEGWAIQGMSRLRMNWDWLFEHIGPAGEYAGMGPRIAEVLEEFGNQGEAMYLRARLAGCELA